MGPLSWSLAGIVAALLARLIPFFRRSLLVELLLGVFAAFAAGLGATALDFGGWSELDWLATAFAALIAFTTIGLLRIARLRSSTQWRPTS
jgi:hypothetical protein